MERVPAEKNSVSVESWFLTRAEFHRLSDVPPEAEWFANIDNENTRRAYRNDVGDFIRFAAIERPDPSSTVRKESEKTRRGFPGFSVRRAGWNSKCSGKF